METKRLTFGKRQISKIAREYGFWIEFSCMYDTFPTTFFGRINEEENGAYFSNIAKDINGEPIVLVGREDDRFENPEHVAEYFNLWRNEFWKAYPKFNSAIMNND